MSNIKILIAEDEQPLRQTLHSQITNLWPEAEIVAACANGAEALKQFELLSPDVVFLDIRMPVKSGLEVAKKIGARAFIVFTTAYDEYAITAFESGAIDYILKPIETNRLIETIKRVKSRLGNQSPENLEFIFAELQSKMDQQENKSLKWVTATIGTTVKMIAIDDVLYFQSDQKYTKVVTKDLEAIIRVSLKQLMARLNEDRFWQTHRSAIVAVDTIDSIYKDELGGWLLSLKGREETLPVNAEFHRRIRALF